ncbi:MAG: hypothetical protein Q7Q73_19380 [Verrucomicrobiota bacterium JB024]|nr:hypothetical protein [Verrucomicrobiota bacterium JB024]
MIKKSRWLLIAAGLPLAAVFFSSVTLNAQTITVPSPAPDSVSVTVGTTVVRDYSDNPLTLGFNVQWASFQGAPTLCGKLWNSNTGTLSAELVNFLKGDFAGALYRYPGGEANYFEWQKTVGTNRSPVTRTEGLQTYIVYFGFDEFMEMVEAVGGQATCTMNIYSIDGTPISDASWPALKQTQLGWLEYANAPVNEDWNGDGTCQGQLRANNGHAAPYNISIWELGNELDLKISYQTYVNRCADLIAAMRAHDPYLNFVIHGRTGAWDAKPTIAPNPPYSVYEDQSSWRDWHNALLDSLGQDVWAVAMHPYYDGGHIPWIDSYTVRTWLDAVDWATGQEESPTAPAIALTENACWPADVDDTSTWPPMTSIKGAVSVSDYTIKQQQQPQVQMALNHALCIQSPWSLFSEIDPVTGKYVMSDTFAPRPIAYALKLAARVCQGADVLETAIETSNLSGYNYDVRAFGYQYGSTGPMGAFMVNRAQVYRTVGLSLPGWSTGEHIMRIDAIGGDDDTQLWSRYVSTDVVDETGSIKLPQTAVLNALDLGPNLVINGDFENGTLRQIPTDWIVRLVSGVTGNAVLVADAADSVNGDNVVRLQASSATGGVNLVQPKWKNALLDADGVSGTYPDDSFVFRANVRTSGTTADKVRLKLQVFNANNTYLASSPVSATAPADTAGSWEPLALEFVPAELLAGEIFGYSELVLMNHSASGYADFDGATLQHRENKATNPYFADIAPADNSPDGWVSRCNGTGTVSYFGAATPRYVRLSKTQTGDGNQFLQVHGSSSELANRQNTRWRLRAWVRYQDLDASGAVLKVQLFSTESGYLGTSPIGEKMTGSSPTGGSGWVQVALEFYPAELFGAESFSRAEIMLQNNSATGNVDVRYMSLEALD